MFFWLTPYHVKGFEIPTILQRISVWEANGWQFLVLFIVVHIFCCDIFFAQQISNPLI
jgi:hypothetical protein